MNRIFPFIDWLKTYRKEWFLRDLFAGLTVAVVLVPQSMSYAMIAGLPPIYGLYAASIPSIVAALWGSSRLLSTGPVAIVSLLTFSSILPYAKPGSVEFIAMAINLAAIVGTIQLLMGVFKMGFVMRFVSHPVIVGFTNAGAIIIATTQIKHLLGINLKDSEFILPVFVDIFKNIPNTNVYTLMVGLVSIAIILGGKRINSNFPSAMFAALLAILCGYFFKIEQYGVSIVGQMPSGFPSFSLPFTGHMEVFVERDIPSIISIIPTFIDIETSFRLIGPGIVIAIVGFMEALAISKSIAEKTKEHLNINQELIGQGMSNIVGSFFNSFAVSGSFSRSAVNLQAGDR
ncbi:MAG: SulP family inorganic anion transporter, partial [Thermodesulfovibrionales bacterium]